LEGLYGYLRGRVLQHDGRGWATTVAAHQIGRRRTSVDNQDGCPLRPTWPLACATTQHRQTLLQHPPLHSRPGAGRLYITAHQAPPSSRLPLNATSTLRLITDLLLHIPLLSPYDVVLPLSFFSSLPLPSSAVLSIYFMTFYVAVHLMMTNKAVNRNVTK
jgi:hypothetical protein